MSARSLDRSFLKLPDHLIARPVRQNHTLVDHDQPIHDPQQGMAVRRYDQRLFGLQRLCQMVDKQIFRLIIHRPGRLIEEE